MVGAMSDNVILVGFMGAGKSSVGRILARHLGRCFVETDDMITAHESRSIPEIFSSQGEAYFRALEEDMVRLLALKRGDVVFLFPLATSVIVSVALTILLNLLLRSR